MTSTVRSRNLSGDRDADRLVFFRLSATEAKDPELLTYYVANFTRQVAARPLEAESASPTGLIQAGFGGGPLLDRRLRGAQFGTANVRSGSAVPDRRQREQALA